LLLCRRGDAIDAHDNKHRRSRL